MMNRKNITGTTKSVLAFLFFFGSVYAALGQTLKDAIRLTVNEQYDEATQLFQQLIQREPANATNYYYFGDNYIQQENFDSAKIVFEKGDEVDSKNPLNKIGLGMVTLYEAKVAEANTKAEKAWQAYQSMKAEYENSANKTELARTEIEKAFVNAEKAKADAEKEKVNVDKAYVYFDKALAFAGTKNSVAYIEFAKALIVSPNKNLAKAMEYIDKAIALDPRSIEAYIVKGDIFTERNEGTPAAENYNKALDLDKISLKALLRKAILYRRTTSYDVAIATLEEASSIDPSFAPAYREMAENYFAKRTKDGLAKAIDFYNRYLTLSKNNFSARLRYAQFLFIAKEYQKALTEVIQLTQLKPDNIYAQRIKAYSSLETGDYKTTKATLDVLFQKIDKSKIVQKDLEYYGKSLAKTEQDSLAVIYYRQAFEMDTNRVDLLREIADAFYKMKKYHEAAEVYREKINTGVNVMANDYKQLGQSYFFEAQDQRADSALILFRQADSAFAKLNEMSPKWASGYMWRAKANSLIDPSSSQGLAKPFYEKYVELALADTANATKYRDGLIESYEYLGNYYALKNEFSLTEEYLKKILEFDPANEKAKKGLKMIREMREGKKAPQK